MEWIDQGFLLSSRPLQENKKILAFFTRDHGKWGGVYRQKKTIAQPWLYQLQWKARLEDHLGQWITLDPVHKKGGACFWITHPGKPYALASILGLFNHLLGDRDPHPCLFDGFLLFLESLGVLDHSWMISYISLELLLLKEIGFSLDLKKCALTQTHQDLSFVSPTTGRAVTEKAAGHYVPKLLPLPPFLGNPSLEKPISSQDVHHGLKLTGHFLNRIYKENLQGSKQEIPILRETLLSWVTQLPCLKIDQLPPLIHEIAPIGA